MLQLPTDTTTFRFVSIDNEDGMLVTITPAGLAVISEAAG